MFVIREARLNEAEYIKNMYDTYIGIDFYTLKDIEDMYQSDNKYLYVCVNDEDLIVGVFYYIIDTFYYAKNILHLGNDMKIDDIDDDTRVGILKTACIDNSYRKQGIYKSLQDKGEEIFVSNHAKYSLVTSTKYLDNDTPIEGVMRVTGYKNIALVEKPWRGMDGCRVCKQSSCICDAVLYAKEL